MVIIWTIPDRMQPWIQGVSMTSWMVIDQPTWKSWLWGVVLVYIYTDLSSRTAFRFSGSLEIK